MESSKPGLETWDIVIVVFYFLVIICVGLYAMFKSNRGTVSGYFLAGRFMTFIPVGASLFASNIGSEHFIGLAGSGAATGISVGAFELNALLILQLLGWFFLPVYIASGCCTLPEYLHRRFGGQRIRVWISSVYLILYIFTKISVNLFSGALFIKLALGWDLYFAIILMLAMTAFSTVTGGLAAVIYTDTLCTFLMILGSTLVSIIGLQKIGGYDNLRGEFMTAVSNDTLYSNSSCGWPPEDSFVMLRGANNPDLPWVAFFLGHLISSSVWYWCGDQMIVQRALSAKSITHAQAACVFASFLKIFPFFTLVIPGMVGRILSPDRVACSVSNECEAICGSRVACTNIAFPEMVLMLMPTGLRGLMMAVLIAALMSDLTSIFNSAGTLFTIDVYERFRAKATVRELMIVGRLCVAMLTVLSIVWIPVIQNVQEGQLYVYIIKVSSYFAPPIGALFWIAILWPRATEKGAFASLVVGFIVGAIRMALDFSYLSKGGCGTHVDKPAIIKIHYMYFAMTLFWICIATNVVVSLLTKPLPDANVARLTWWTRFDKKSQTDHMETEKDEDILHMEKLNPKGKGEGEKTKDVDETPTEKENEEVHFEKAPQSKLRRFISWFCGYEAGSEEAIRAAKEAEKRAEFITSLEQAPWEKAVLSVGSVTVVSICMFMLLFFSI